jgi:hypothetical protein
VSLRKLDSEVGTAELEMVVSAVVGVDQVDDLANGGPPASGGE